ncbi:unnamed protein product (mitochondrion) [Plasmodiophora brassicae]|uniref:Calmodulin n=2 Tax=Plasmodiophora brassicae TaxID=37360 RepID=A0A3P3YKN0_PLABS|nr:unnamed protein product [Plasmodiophora brassicae]
MAPPLLPGMTIVTNPKYDHPRTTRFDLVGGQCFADPRAAKLVPAPKHTNIFVHDTSTRSRSQATLKPRLSNLEVTMGTIPAWIAYDNKVLAFLAYFRSDVHESQVETHRVTVIDIMYYLQDGTVRIVERKEDNSGMRNGAFLNRHRVPLAETGCTLPDEGAAPFLSPVHFAVGRDLVIYKRTYHIVDADAFTRAFYADVIGEPLFPAEPIPEDPFHARIHRAEELTASQGRREPVSAHYESVHGKPQRWQLVKHRKFLENDGQVLRFWAIWKSRVGDDRNLVVHFFLADDTCEVLEIAQANSGRDPFPSLVKRQTLRKSVPRSYGIDNIGEDLALQAAAADGACYTAGDLRTGQTISVFGREVLLLRADDFTRRYYVQRFGIDQRDFVDPGRAPEGVEQHQRVEHHADEDEIVEQATAASKIRRNRLPREEEKRLTKSVMRFKARQVSSRAEDIAREFVVTFFPVDETVSVFENPLRNSGFMAGKFLERKLIFNRNAGRMFKQEDFFVGAVLDIHSFLFELTGADSSTERLLRGQPPNWLHTDIRSVVIGLRNMFKGKNVALRKTFRNLDHDKDGYLTRHEFEAILDEFGWDLERAQVDALFNRYDRDHDGMISFQEFAQEVEGAPGSSH